MSEIFANQSESINCDDREDNNKSEKSTSPTKEGDDSETLDSGAEKFIDEAEDNANVNSEIPALQERKTNRESEINDETNTEAKDIKSLDNSREQSIAGSSHSGTQLHVYSILPDHSEGHDNETQLNRSLLEHCESHKKILTVSTLSDEPKTNPETMDQVTEETTNDGDVEFNMAGPKTQYEVVTSEPTATGPSDAKSKPSLERHESLNPRIMIPPGLEVLNNKYKVAVRQQMDMDIMSGCGGPNTYKVSDMNNEQIFFAAETSGCLCRWACGPNRQFQMDIFSTTDDFVLNFHRSCCRCDCCCCLDCFLCLQKLYVVDSLGRTLGSIRQKFSVFSAKYDIVDDDNNVLFKVLGPCCPCRCYTEIYFQIFDKTGERQIGRIQKKWGGDRTDEINVDHEFFEITFPAKLNSVDKALIIGAAFLVNFMYLEMS